MSVVVQRTYSPEIRASVLGMVADMSEYNSVTRICNTSGGITFGKAVSQDRTDYKKAVLGGSYFLGITHRDITVDGAPIAYNDSVHAPVDTYGFGRNMGILTRGPIWVKANGVIVPGDPLYYDANGEFTNSASGSAASGYFDFTANPAAGQKISIGEMDAIFYALGATSPSAATGASGASGSTGASGIDEKLGVLIGNTLSDTLTNLMTALNADVNTQAARFSYNLYPYFPNQGGGQGVSRLEIAAKNVGTTDNGVFISTDVTGATASGSQLSGGSASATAVAGGYWRTAAIAGELAIASLGIQTA